MAAAGGLLYWQRGSLAALIAAALGIFILAFVLTRVLATRSPQHTTDADRRRWNRHAEPMAAMLSNAPMVLLRLDDKGRVASADGRVRHYLDRSAEDLKDQHVCDVLGKEAGRAWRAALEGRHGTSIVEVPPRTLEVHISRLEVPEGKKKGPMGLDEGAIAVILDVTERQRGEEADRVALERLLEIEQLKTINRLKTQLLNTASHELNTPITPLRLQSHLLASGRLGELNDRQRRAVDIIHRNLLRLADLVTDILDVARVDSGKLKVEPEETNLSHLVHALLEEQEVAAKEHDLDLRAFIEPNVRVQADPKRITQVVQNLLANAFRFTDSPGQVTVRLMSGDDATLSVSDTGVGMDQGQIDGLFTPFGQVHEDSRGGTGLGLYICKGIMEGHDGSIRASSPGPGQGTTFEVRMPLVASPPRRTLEKAL